MFCSDVFDDNSSVHVVDAFPEPTLLNEDGLIRGILKIYERLAWHYHSWVAVYSWLFKCGENARASNNRMPNYHPDFAFTIK